jgi:hypothetical protein
MGFLAALFGYVVASSVPLPHVQSAPCAQIVHIMPADKWICLVPDHPIVLPSTDVESPE